jgi:enoyl-CoA hydratase/carnithine racemase
VGAGVEALRAALGPAVYGKQVFRAPLLGEAGADPKTYGKTLFETDAVRAWVDDRAGEDDVVIVSFKSKMNTIGPSVIDGLVQAIELAEQDYKGVVIWQPTSLKLGTPGGPFSAGANLEEAMPAFMMGGAKGIEPFVKKFQEGMLRVKYANVPVVAAVSGIALGGGCELMLHSAKRVVHVESYIGLVEVGVGLVPAGGGLKEAALRAADAATAANATTDILKFVTKSFENAAMAKVSSSAHDARAMGYVKPSDTIVFNVFELLDTAKKEARAGRDRLSRAVAREGRAGRRPLGDRDDQGVARQHARRPLHQRPRLPDREPHRRSGVRRRRRSRQPRRRAMAARARAPRVRRAARHAEDAGADHGHVADRQAGA